MSDTIILNCRVIYNKNTATLMDVEQKKDVITLTTPANNCLQILLDNGMEITTQKELFEEVWEKHGIPINTNTLYQNIAMIRKAFRQLGVEEEIIVTIPRRGMVIADGVQIADFIADPASPEEDAGEAEVPDNAIHTAQRQAEAEETSAVTPGKIKRRAMLTLLYVVVMTLTGFAASFAYHVYQNTQSRFYSYRHLGDAQQCQIYTDSRGENQSLPAVAERLAKSGLRCDNRERVYVSSFSGTPRESFILCDGDILVATSQCRSQYRSFSEGMR
ncbi:TPA: winged helix-turn-helix domain-containing protein [Serratia marcescens]